MNTYYILPNNQVINQIELYKYTHMNKGNHPFKRITRDMCYEFVRDLMSPDKGNDIHEYSVRDVTLLLNLTTANALGWLYACQNYGYVKRNGYSWIVKEV